MSHEHGEERKSATQRAIDRFDVATHRLWKHLKKELSLTDGDLRAAFTPICHLVEKLMRLEKAKLKEANAAK